MNDNIKRHIVIRTDTKEEMFEVRDRIHKQLVGNEDYIKSHIVLNTDGNYIHLYIFNNVEDMPKIEI